MNKHEVLKTALERQLCLAVEKTTIITKVTIMSTASTRPDVTPSPLFMISIIMEFLVRLTMIFVILSLTKVGSLFKEVKAWEIRYGEKVGDGCTTTKEEENCVDNATFTFVDLRTSLDPLQSKADR